MTPNLPIVCALSMLWPHVQFTYISQFSFSVAGVCALSIDSEKNYIAYPSSSQTGEVQIFDAMNLVRAQSVMMHYLFAR